MSGWRRLAIKDGRLKLARAALLWEAVCPAVWPTIALLLGFAVLAAFDVPASLPFWLHDLLLVGFFLALAITLLRAVRRIRLPDRRAAQRRIERDSDLAHRPLQVLDDQLAGTGPDPFAAALWRVHRQRMAEAAASLRLTVPRAGLVAEDPYAIRFALSLFLLLGIAASGEDFWARVGRSLTPHLENSVAAASIGFDLWINPPDYTGLPPIYVGSAATHSADDKPLAVPTGSTVLAQVHGGAAPSLMLDGKKTSFTAVGPSDYSVSSKLQDAGHIAIVQSDRTLAHFALRIIPDDPPSAAWGAAVTVTEHQALKLDYLAIDDYGVKGVTLEVRRTEGDEKPLQIELAVPANTKNVKGTSYQDLTPSPWAGLPVELKLIAHDAIGQVGISAPAKLTLPERFFHNPVAKAIIEQRKLLTRDPGEADAISETLSDLSERPALFHNDTTVFLSLRAASDRLKLVPGIAELASLQELLWDTATRIEDGDVPEAQKNLRQAEKALQDALDRNAPDAEIEKLTRDLDKAVHDYLNAMMAEAAKQGPQQNPQNGQDGQQITPQDIQKMLDQAHDLARSGAKDAAKEMLSKLQDMLESLRAGTAPSGEGQQGQQQMRQMQDLAQKQQQLLDRAYRQAQHGDAGQDGQESPPQNGGKQGKPGGEGQDLAGAQDSLRKQLGELMRKMGQQGDMPQSFDRAEKSMKGAADALKRGAPGEAVQPQGEALEQLHQAMRELSEKMQPGNGQASPEQAGRDPFGRNGPGNMDTGDVKIPGASEIQRSREILDELRRRAGDRDRPAIERDYINRLLQRF
jgi:uncharacterized protein (TIGR02302 family)